MPSRGIPYERICPSPRRRQLRDLIAGFACLCVMLGSAWHNSNGHVGHLQAVGVVLALIASLPVIVVRRRPIAVLITTMTGSAALQLLNYPPTPPFGAAFTLFWISLSRTDESPWTAQLTKLAVGLLLMDVAAYFIGHGPGHPWSVAPSVLVWAVAWFAGERYRLRRAELHELHERARRAELDAERERRLALAEERTRIARDLHDSAAHAINVIAIQAGAARLQMEHDPERSRQALETIESVARQTVGDIDQIIHGLRGEESAPEGVEPPAGLAALDALIDQQRAAGLAVSLEATGERRAVTPNVDRTAYRILQEALTNSARHGSGPTLVKLDFGDRALELSVSNPASNGHATRPGGGHGLLGMRERVTLVGGELTAGREGDEFRVRARLPYGAPA